MNVLSPWFFFHILWLFPAILLLYFLKLRREKVVVPSVLLWHRAVDDMRVNSPFQRLTKNLLLFLQLLIAALLLLAVMRPVLTDVEYDSERIFILIDNSGSMTASDGDRTRLESAAEVAREIVEGMARDDEAMIVAFSDRSRALTQLTGERALLLRALDGLEPTHVASDLLPAIKLVQGYSLADRPPQVIIISDGAFPTDTLTGDDQLPKVRFVPVGDTGDNVAITAVSALRSLEKDHRLQVSATIANYSRKPLAVPISFHLEGQPVGVREAQLDAMVDGRPGRKVVIFDDLDGTRGRLEVRVEHEDVLDADNHAFLDLRPDAEVRVLLVSSGDPFIEAALASDDRVLLESMTPAFFAEKHGSAGDSVPQADLIVFDTWAPEHLEHASSIFLGAVPPLPGFSAAEEDVEQPRFLDQNYDHPLTRFVNFQAIQIAKSLAMTVPDQAVVLWETRESPIMTLSIKDQRRTVVCSITTTDSDWATTAAWPMFFGNAIDWFGGGSASTGSLQYDAGEVVFLKLPEETLSVRVTRPDERQRTLVRGIGSDAIVFGETALSGFYDVHHGGEGVEERGAPDQILAVNFAAEDESHAVVVEDLDLPGAEVEGGGALDALTNREIWRPVLMALFGLLLFEWWYYHKKIGTV